MFELRFIGDDFTEACRQFANLEAAKEAARLMRLHHFDVWHNGMLVYASHAY